MKKSLLMPFMGFAIWILYSTLALSQVQEDERLHGRINLKLSAGPGGSLSPCLKTQGQYDLRIALDDCTETEGLFAYSKYFLRGGTQKVWARAFIDLSLKAPMERNWVDTQGGDKGLIIGNRNFFAEVGNILGSEEVVWVGNRSYDFEDIWLLDLRILDQHGPGLGINHINVGTGLLGLAFFRVIPKNGGPSQDTFDLRWSAIPLLSGQLKFALLSTRSLSSDSKTGEKKYAPMHGSQFVAIHHWDDEDSENKIFAQIGRGLYGGSDQLPFDQGRGAELNNTGETRDASLFDQNLFSDVRQAMSQSTAWRVGDQFILYPEYLPFSIHTAAIYEKVDFGGLRYQDEAQVFERADMETRAYILKPSWDISSRQSLALSHSAVLIHNGLGYKRRLLDGKQADSRAPIDRRLQRNEVAYIVRPLGWGGGTEAKFYAAYNQWNPEIRRDVSSGPLQQKNSGWTGGITMSLWW
ncbi:MAG: carbohydrate porin [Proteobacteria bacterium]|nr:carbohydrate porin [Pseudomonadota bacterium]